MPKVRVVLAEDHKVVADGLASLLKDNFELVAVVHDGRELVDAAERLQPDVVVTDLSMPMLNGIDAVRLIRSSCKETRVLVLTMHRELHLAAAAIRAGASGYVLKVSPGEELVQAIYEVAQGRVWITPLLGTDPLTLLLQAREPRETSPLTPKQREVLQLIAEGKTMKEVAAILNMSPRTVETHKYNIMGVLGVRTTAELVQYATRAKMVGE